MLAIEDFACSGALFRDAHALQSRDEGRSRRFGGRQKFLSINLKISGRNDGTSNYEEVWQLTRAKPFG